jgi:hypothetical protein
MWLWSWPWPEWAPPALATDPAVSAAIALFRGLRPQHLARNLL